MEEDADEASYDEEYSAEYEVQFIILDTDQHEMFFVALFVLFPCQDEMPTEDPFPTQKLENTDEVGFINTQFTLHSLMSISIVIKGKCII